MGIFSSLKVCLGEGFHGGREGQIKRCEAESKWLFKLTLHGILSQGKLLKVEKDSRLFYLVKFIIFADVSPCEKYGLSYMVHTFHKGKFTLGNSISQNISYFFFFISELIHFM